MPVPCTLPCLGGGGGSPLFGRGDGRGGLFFGAGFGGVFGLCGDLPLSMAEHNLGQGFLNYAVSKGRAKGFLYAVSMLYMLSFCAGVCL